MATPAERFRLPSLSKIDVSIPVDQADDHSGQWVLRRVASNGVVSVDNQMFSVGQRLPSRARRRVRGRDHDPGLEQEPPHQDGRQSPVRTCQEDQSRWTARQASTGYEASSVSRNLTRRASSGGLDVQRARFSSRRRWSAPRRSSKGTRSSSGVASEGGEAGLCSPGCRRVTAGETGGTAE